MIRKSLKNKILFVLFCLCLTMFSCLMFSLGATTSYADENGFSMIFGATVRAENPSGIRYQATISSDVYDAEAEYGILIVPTDYLTSNNITENYFAKLEEAGYSQDKLSIAKSAPVLQDDGSYLLTGYIVNIRESNFNRAFTGIAFSLKNGVYSYASSNDNTRSIMTVASRGLTSEDTEDSDKTLLKSMIGAYSKEDQDLVINVNQEKKYIGKVKFDVYLKDENSQATVKFLSDNNSVTDSFTLSKSCAIEGVTCSDLGSDWYSFTFDTQKITFSDAENIKKSDVIASITVTSASEGVILSNVRYSELKIAEYSNAYVGNANYFATEMSDVNDYDNAGYSLKVTAKAHSDSIAQGSRSSDTAIYIPYSGTMPTDAVAVTWKAKVDKNSFVKEGSSVSFNSTYFYKYGMLSNWSTFFGSNSATYSYGTEDSNGWVSYTLSISKDDISKFFIEKDGSIYFKTVCGNTSGVLFNDGNWTSPTNTSYTFYVDELNFYSGEFTGAYVGSGKYFEVSYSNDENFTTGTDGSSLKVTAKAYSDNIAQGSRSSDTAIYIPYSGTMPTDAVTVTWKAKVDKNSFVKEGSSVSFNSTNFYKYGMLSNWSTFFGSNSATYSYGTEDSDGWVSYTLSISKDDISKFFIEKEGSIYFKTVCGNTSAVLFNDGNWVTASNTSYTFYVDDLRFAETTSEEA